MNKMLRSMAPYMTCRMRSSFNTHARKRECISIIDGLFTMVSRGFGGLEVACWLRPGSNPAEAVGFL